MTALNFPANLLRPTYVYIDLDALAHNFAVLRALLPKNVEILAMVKADAYGHGAVPIARQCVDCGAAALGVATVEEGLELRENGIETPVLVMGGLMGLGGAASKVMVEHDLTPVIHSSEVIDSLEQAAKTAGKKISVHIKIDSGMSRLGILPTALPFVLAKLKNSKFLQVSGTMSHLACADQEDFTTLQVKRFVEGKQTVEAQFGKLEVWHLANSVGILQGNSVSIDVSQQGWARSGLALYGTSGGVPLPNGVELKPVMHIKSRIALVKTIPIGSSVSYGATFTAKRKTRIAVVPIGYADGYPWSCSGNSVVLVRGQRVKVVGRVTMDMIMLDITGLADVRVGDEVTLLGEQANDCISAEELAAWAGTISYEILARVSKRVPRIYQQAGKSFSWS